MFPTIEGLVEPAAAQAVRETPNGLVVSLAVSNQLVASEPRIAGIVTGIDARPVAFEAPMPGKLVPGKGVPAVAAVAPAASSADALSLGLALLFALIGGMILNLMPCVFPVLSLKILGFAGGGHGNGAAAGAMPGEARSASRRAMRIHGIAFAVGVVASFIALAAILLGLRAAGEAVGWGFQLQSPLVVTLLALLFFLIGLNLSGVFEFGNVLPGNVAGATLRHPLADALFSGVLAALVASPCTAPFMGAALGFALTQGTMAALAVFAVMGVGMALPYLLLSFFPAWLKRLPTARPLACHIQAGDGIPDVCHRGLARLGAAGAGRRGRPGVVRRCAGAARVWRLVAGPLPTGRRPLGRSGSHSCGHCGRKSARTNGFRARPGTKFFRIRLGSLLESTHWRAQRGGKSRIRRLHRRLVRDLPGQQEGGP